MEQIFRAGDGDRQVVAVFREQVAATEARERLIRAGVQAERVRVGDKDDRTASVRAEMRSELEHALVAPVAGVAWPKEALKSMSVAVPAATLLASLVMYPVASVAAPDWPMWAKVVLAVAVGAMTGGTVAIVIAAAGARGPAEPLAAETGVTVRVATADKAVLDCLQALNPLRIDVVTPEGAPTGTTPAEQPDHALSNFTHRLAHQTDPDWHEDAAHEG